MSILGVGHSNHSKTEFARLLRGVDVLIDTRSYPSSHFERFRRAELERWIPTLGIEYRWVPALGGWRWVAHRDHAAWASARGVDIGAYGLAGFPRQRIAADRPGAARGTWTNQGLYDYSWFTVLEEHQEACRGLVREFVDADRHAAVMCCEAQWWRCHRSMIADRLAHAGVHFYHLKQPAPKRPATLRYRLHRELLGLRLARYEPEILEAWQPLS